MQSHNKIFYRYNFSYPLNQIANVKSYVIVDKELSNDEYNKLNEILKSFPNAANKKEWPKRFAEFDVKGYSKKLLTIAANSYDEWGNTMLGIVAENGKHVDALKKLIDLGANLETPDMNLNKLALHWAIANGLSNDNKNSFAAAEMVKCLLDAGAQTTSTCYKSITPLEYAIERGYKAAAELIKQANYKRGIVNKLFQTQPATANSRIASYLSVNAAKTLSHTTKQSSALFAASNQNPISIPMEIDSCAVVSSSGRKRPFGSR